MEFDGQLHISRAGESAAFEARWPHDDARIVAKSAALGGDADEVAVDVAVVVSIVINGDGVGALWQRERETFVCHFFSRHAQHLFGMLAIVLWCIVEREDNLSLVAIDTFNFHFHEVRVVRCLCCADGTMPHGVCGKRQIAA